MLIALHSFTPVFKGVARPWHVGMMYNRDPRFAQLCWRCSSASPGLVVGDNEPYGVSDTTDYTIPVHGERRDLHHVVIEIRQDLIADATGQRAWARILARLLPPAYSAFSAGNCGPLIARSSRRPRTSLNEVQPAHTPRRKSTRAHSKHAALHADAMTPGGGERRRRYCNIVGRIKDMVIRGGRTSIRARSRSFCSAIPRSRRSRWWACLT